MFTPRSLVSILLILAAPAFAQKLKKDEKLLVTNLEAHVNYLAADKLEGRRAGTEGERLAIEYIKAQFEKNGIEPKGESGSFYQSFGIWEGRNYEKNSFLHINGEVIPSGITFRSHALRKQIWNHLHQSH